METDSTLESIENLKNEIESISAEIEGISSASPTGAPLRFLKNSEIIDILKRVPIFPGLTPAIGKVARNSIIRQEKYKLREVLLSPDVIKDFSDTYIHKFNLSKVEPGTAVGFTAAEGISAPISQQTFNSFQNAGSSKNMLGGIEGFLETLAGQRRHLPFMVVHYKEKVGVEDILLDKRYSLRTVTVADCVIRNIVETTTTLYLSGKPDWYEFYNTIVDPTAVPPANGWILRLFLSLDALYLHRIRPRQIADLLSSEKDANGLSLIKCIYSPTIEHDDMDTIIMDVYINNIDAIIGDYAKHIKTGKKDGDKGESKIDPELAGLFYFRNIFIPKLGTFKLKGLDGISDVEPIGVPVQMSLYAEYPTERYSSEYPILKEKYSNYRFIKLNQVYMRSNNLRLIDVTLLLRAVGITRILEIKDLAELSKEFNDLDLLVELPPRPQDFPDKDTYGVLPLVKFYIGQNTKNIDSYRKSQKENRRDVLGRLTPQSTPEERKQIILQASSLKIYREPTVIAKAATVYYAETTGSDYASLFNMDDVDYTRSYTNNMHELLLYYGIEAVKTYIVRDLMILVKLSDTYIDPRHALLVADWMTCLGVITPMTPKGMKKHDLGAVANAAFREPMKGFKNEAMFNRSDKLSGIAGPIAIGTYIEMGTGVIDIKPANNLRTKALLDTVKKQGKKLSLGMGSKIISLLEQPDLINPMDRGTVDSKIEFRELNIPLIAGPEDSQFREGTIQLGLPGLDQLFPLVSKELRLAVENSKECERPSIPMELSITPRGGDHPVEPLPVAPVIIPENAQGFIADEKPPETVAAGETVDLDFL